MYEYVVIAVTGQARPTAAMLNYHVTVRNARHTIFRSLDILCVIYSFRGEGPEVKGHTP